MAVTFTFDPDNVTDADPEFGTFALHDQTQFTENEVTFFYSSSSFSGLGLPDAGIFAGPVPALGFNDPVTAVLEIGNTDPNNAFLTNPIIALNSIPGNLDVNDIALLINYQNVAENGDVNFDMTVGFFGAPFGLTTVEFANFFIPDGPDETPEINKIIFTTFGDAQMNLNSITATPTCVLTGTRFTRADGAQVAVEDLTSGDRIRTTKGLTTVKWVGRQFIDTRLTHPGRVNPICIRAGALAEGLPARDLFLSADHAIGIDGILVNAGAMLNGRTIFRVAQMPREGFTYHHVETDAHELLLTEGVGVESFIDYVGREGFDNAPPALSARIPEMKLPRVSAPRLLPAWLCARLDARAQVLARAALAA